MYQYIEEKKLFKYKTTYPFPKKLRKIWLSFKTETDLFQIPFSLPNLSSLSLSLCIKSLAMLLGG